MLNHTCFPQSTHGKSFKWWNAHFNRKSNCLLSPFIILVNIQMWLKKLAHSFQSLLAQREREREESPGYKSPAKGDVMRRSWLVYIYIVYRDLGKNTNETKFISRSTTRSFLPPSPSPFTGCERSQLHFASALLGLYLGASSEEMLSVSWLADKAYDARCVRLQWCVRSLCNYWIVLHWTGPAQNEQVRQKIGERRKMSRT